MNRFVWKKKQGTYDFLCALIIMIICILAIYCMIVMYANTNKALDSQNHISSLLRSYLVKMETGGELTSSDVDKLISNLELYGMSEIQLYGNFSAGIIHEAIKENYGPADYGQQVELRITGMQKVESMTEDENAFLGLSLEVRELKVDIKQRGIAVR